LAEPDEVQRIALRSPTAVTFTIYWQRSALERAASELGFMGSPLWAFTRLAPGPISVALGELHGLLTSGACAQAVDAAYRSLTAQLLRSAGLSSISGPMHGPRHPGVRRAVKRLRADLAEPLSLEKLGTELRMSKSHLVRCFQQALGVPPQRYRKLVRLQRARRLLESGHSVGETSVQTGFADAPHLSRDFRDWLGVSPAAWRSAWRASNPWKTQLPRTIPPQIPDVSDYIPQALASNPSARR
jgi:AraC-like DNA-binding protein